MGRDKRAVAGSLGFAREAAAEGDFVNAVRWLRVVRAVDGRLLLGLERTLAGWIHRMRTAELGCEPATVLHRLPNSAAEGNADD